MQGQDQYAYFAEKNVVFLEDTEKGTLLIRRQTKVYNWANIKPNRLKLA